MNSDSPALGAERYRSAGWWRDETLWDDVSAAVARHPDKVAVVGHHGATGRSEVLSYAQLARYADRFAGALLELNVAPGEVVSFQLPNWWQVAALHLACVRIGAVANPIITILRRREVAFILERVRARVCVVPGEFRGFDHAAMAADIKAGLPGLEHVFVIGSSPPPPGTEDFEAFFCATRWEDKHPPAELDARRPSADAPAQIMFTSGTTGEPKGVLHSHNTMDCGLRAVSEPLGLGADDVVLMFSPLGHQTGYLYGMCMPLKYGMKLVLQDQWDPEVMLRLIGDERVTWTMGSTTFVLDACAAAERLLSSMPGGLDLSSLRYFTCGGAPIPPKAVTEARAKLGTQLVAVWGMTEIGVCTTTLPTDSDEKVCDSDGVPSPWVDLRVDDAGRLLVRGPSTHLTYFGRHDLYEASFDDGGWFDTGDLARLDPDGYIRITGRSKDLIIRGGENIPVAEVEAGVISHPMVHEVAVVAYPDERLGERVCAVIVPAPAGSGTSEPPTLEDVRNHLARLGMAKPFWPDRLEVRTELPKTASGKTQKFVLRQELAGAEFIKPIG